MMHCPRGLAGVWDNVGSWVVGKMPRLKGQHVAGAKHN